MLIQETKSILMLAVLFGDPNDSLKLVKHPGISDKFISALCRFFID